MQQACLQGADHLSHARLTFSHNLSYKAISETLRHLRNCSLMIEQAEEAVGEYEARKMRGEVESAAKS